MLGLVLKCARGLWSAGFTALRRSPRRLRSRHAHDRRGLSPHFEGLEQRRLLAANQISFDSNTSSIVIQGTSKSDTAIISVSPDGAVHVQLETAQGSYHSHFPASMASAVKFYGGKGDDTFQNFSHLPSEAYGDAGADIFTGGSSADRFFGGAGDDSLFGGDGDDVLDGGAGHDWLSGWTGNDTLLGGSGKDYLAGGVGDDVLDGGNDADELYGQEGNDELTGGAGNDVLVGGLGNDKLYGGAGNDQLSGEDGDDELYGDGGHDWLSGWTGNDTLMGGDGKDYLAGGIGDDVLDGGDDVDELYGQEGDDELTGGAGNDVLVGAQGNDTLYGGAGNDQLSGEDGDDEIYGEEGHDWLSGWTGNDILFGGDGNDELAGGEGDDDLNGGDGDDELFGGSGNDWLWGGSGNDLIYGDGGNNYLIGGVGDDSLIGSTGNDLLDGGAGQDKLVGSEGNDVLIGGMGQDDLRGNEGSDLMLGGATVYEDDRQSYWALLNEWSTSAPYATRIEQMESALFAAQLASEETVFDDGVADALFGGGGQDWFFITGSMSIYRPDIVEPLPHGEHGEHGGHDEDIAPHHNSLQIVAELPAVEGFDLIDSLDKLSDRQTDERIHSLIPHLDNSTLQREHLSLFELVRYDRVTHIAVRSGNWSDESTWAKNAIPSNGSRILIPLGVEVNVDREFVAKIATIRVDGTLSFDATRNTELRVDTVVVSSHGTFQMGTIAEPIAQDSLARLLITNTGAINRKWDPFGISRGLISHGKVSIHGAETSSHAALAGPVTAGTLTLHLKSSPTGWKTGDTIAIASTAAGIEQNEVREIVSVFENTILLNQPLSFAHAAPAADLDVHVANLTRNAVIESESLVTARRGHVMFMHNRDVDIAYAGFYKLGRTDKLKALADSVVKSDWKLQSGTGTNQRGRYAVHFHRNGLTNDGNPSVIKGSAVVDSPGWGFVNHSGYVDMTNNVAFDVHGAAFATEVGDEIGGFYGNMAIGSSGSGEESNAREILQDFGHQGDGFWFQGGGVSVVGNIAAGNEGHAFMYYTRGLYEGGPQAQFPTANLSDPSIADGADYISIGQVPVTTFTGNVGYSSAAGLVVRYHLENSTHGRQSLFENSQFWNNGVGVALHYSQNIVLRDLTVIEGESVGTRIGVDQNLFAGNILYDNLTVSGYRTGIDLPRWGNNAVQGGTFHNNEFDIVILSAAYQQRSILLSGFASPPIILMWRELTPVAGVDITFNLVPDNIVLDHGTISYQPLYYVDQRADAVLFPVARADVPAAYVGLTNQQLWDQFGVALGGRIAPGDAFEVPFLAGGLVGPTN